MQLNISESLQQKIFTHSAFEFAYRLPRMQLHETDRYYLPEIVNRFFDTLNIQKGLPKILIDFSTSSLQIVFGLLLLSFYHPFFVLFSFLLLLLVFLTLRFMGPRGLQTSLVESKHKYEVVHWLEELGRTVATFKLAGNTRLPLEKTDELVTNYLHARKAHFRVLIWQFVHMIGFKVLVAAGFLLLGGYLVFEQRMNIGQFVAAEIIILLIFTSVEKLIVSLEIIYDVLTGLEKLGFVSDILLDKSGKANYEPASTHRGIEINIQNLNYRPDDRTGDVLKNINLHIQPGEKVCLSGTSGSGRTLLLRFMSGAYDQLNGSISFNRLPLGNYRLENLRSYIGDLFSSELIFQGSLVENISTGREWVSFEDIKETADGIGLTSFIEQLPEGYGTLLDPYGRRLPKSVVTKILLTRCFAGKPKLVLMDDLLDVFDQEEKQRVESYIFSNPFPTTLVMNTRNRTLLPMFDRLVVLDKGSIIFDGKPAEAESQPWFAVIFP
jgi:ABC-type bacteriocin/lantibiotic exporter with double-glycine peptidase domain